MAPNASALANSASSTLSRLFISHLSSPALMTEQQPSIALGRKNLIRKLDCPRAGCLRCHTKPRQRRSTTTNGCVAGPDSHAGGLTEPRPRRRPKRVCEFVPGVDEPDELNPSR